MNRWHGCNPLSNEDRLRLFDARQDISYEEKLRRQAIGLRVREQIVRRAYQIPRHRSLVVVEQPKRQRRRARG